MKSLKGSLRSAPKQAEAKLHEKLVQTQQYLEAKKQSVEKARLSVKSWVEQKRKEAAATIEQWKANNEVDRLADRADFAADYAAAAVDIASVTIEEAEQAVLEAVAARRDADEAVHTLAAH
jgi:hypothetical protein